MIELKMADDKVAKVSNLMIPKEYHSSLDILKTSDATQQIKSIVQLGLETKLGLHHVSAPLFVQQGKGINDDLNGSDFPVTFNIREMGVNAEVVQSLAKWKRLALAKYNIPLHRGIYTNMHAIRANEIPDNLHSIFVDQWDWEQVINQGDRNISYLRQVVNVLFSIIKDAEEFVSVKYGLSKSLPDEIYFIHSEELLQLYPDLTPKQREYEITKQYGAVFIIGIGGKLNNGEQHDGRAPDYDDWSTENEDGYRGLNGDILVWNHVLNIPMELSSMGIRVSPGSLIRQLELRKQMQKQTLRYHHLLISNQLPLSIGGGIGQSRLCMFLLKKAHVGEISAGLWPAEMVEQCNKHKIILL